MGVFKVISEFDPFRKACFKRIRQHQQGNPKGGRSSFKTCLRISFDHNASCHEVIKMYTGEQTFMTASCVGSLHLKCCIVRATSMNQACQTPYINICRFVVMDDDVFVFTEHLAKSAVEKGACLLLQDRAIHSSSGVILSFPNVADRASSPCKST